jgi:hypothetical protein
MIFDKEFVSTASISSDQGVRNTMKQVRSELEKHISSYSNPLTFQQWADEIAHMAYVVTGEKLKRE